MQQLKCHILIVSQDDLRSFSPQSFFKTVWAYATLHKTHLSLFMSIGDTFFELDDFASLSTEDIVCILWAYSSANTPNPNVFCLLRKAIAANEHYINLFKEIGDTIIMSN